MISQWIHIALFILLVIFYFLRKSRDPIERLEKKWSLVAGLFNFVTGFAFFYLLAVATSPVTDWITINHPLQWKKGPYLVVVCLLTADLFFFLSHYIHHRFNFLWRFHSFHHSAQNINFEVHYRHSFINMVTQGIFFILFCWLTNIHPYFLGFYFSIINVYQILMHSPNMVWPKWLGCVFILPQTHRVHHQIDAMSKNHGGLFSLWDRILNQYQIETSPAPYGIEASHNFHDFSGLIWPRLKNRLNVRSNDIHP